MFCHFASGIGEPKYLAVQGWESLNKLLVEALENYNEVNAVMNLVLFDDAMQHVWVKLLQYLSMVFLKDWFKRSKWSSNSTEIPLANCGLPPTVLPFNRSEQKDGNFLTIYSVPVFLVGKRIVNDKCHLVRLVCWFLVKTLTTTFIKSYALLFSFYFHRRRIFSAFHRYVLPGLCFGSLFLDIFARGFHLFPSGDDIFLQFASCPIFPMAIPVRYRNIKRIHPN